MINKKNLLTVIISCLFAIVIVEIIYNLFYRDSSLGAKLDRSDIYSKYSAEELDKTLPIRHKFNGGECVKRGLLIKTKKMNWHPRYGANDNSVSIDCINNLFTKKTTNVVFYGGSSIFNDEAPNYLTSIGYYALKDNFEQYRSINLANSGARMSNNLSSFIEYIPRINNVDYIIFFDGVNEFTSVQLGSSPEYDTYWAQGVKARINQPEIIILEKLIAKSLFFEILLKKIFKYKSIRDKSNVKFASEKNIKIAAEDYSYRKKIIENLCEVYSVKCIFFLQPAIFFDDTKKSFNQSIEEYNKKIFSKNSYLYGFGYEIIKSQNEDIVDFSKILNGQNNVFFDASHFDKNGSRIIGENILKVIKEY
ncbi:hypothetical protein OAL68_02490 [Candidatus Pelagibacter sp.]|nr:hypothetical protein [Candidatus Pelagibacter sp.]|tara:strand:- start:301 stop:1392 length:1092 start_codon:yes stop_codon:yes gene_type:complete